ncbi:MAG: DCC1-like thiol-disulfide oxidoreductase family protein [Bacteroidota bacterium]
MKTLKNHMILFDGECPMCRAYTQAFVKTGMLDAGGRAAYQTDMNVCPLIDKQRAVNEIALVNMANGEVTYGVESIFKILGNAWPLFTRLFASNPFLWVMRKVYAFISYNRRVIIPASESGNSYNYQPTFKLHYRIAYLLFTWFCTGCILTVYVHLLTPAIPLGNAYREYIICGGQIIFQGIIITTFAKTKLWEYLGNMMTISFGGSLLLLLPLALHRWFVLTPLFFSLAFMAVAGLMFLEHIRRTKLLKIGWTMTITWAFYRAMLLVVILLLG